MKNPFKRTQKLKKLIKKFKKYPTALLPTTQFFG
jgi:hypothetical protein